MKKSYLFMSFLALLLVSCNDSKEKESSSSSVQQSSTPIASTTPSNDESSSSVVAGSNTVTEARWKEVFAALDSTNGTMVSEADMGSADMHMTLEMESATKLHAISYSTKPQQTYVETILNKEGTDYYVYARQSATAKYNKTKVDEAAFTSQFNSLGAPLVAISAQFTQLDIVNKFSSFTFDSSKNAYCGTLHYQGEDMSMDLALELTFDSGNLVSFKASNSDGTSISNYSKLGTTTVTIPTDVN